MPSPFADLLVIELASVLAGPSVGQFFAELGATVIKIENPAGGDVTRSWKLPEESADSDRSAYFAAANWGKQSVALDLEKPEGRAILLDLAARADLVVASYKPGDAEKLGADYATLHAANPRLIYAHVVGYPDDARAGYDAVIQAESGFTFMNGAPDGPPVKMPVALVDILAAHQLKEAMLVALLERERTGHGAYVTVSLLQAAVSALANQASNYLTTGHVPKRLGSEHPNIAPYGTVFDTADGKQIVLAAGTNRQFLALCEVLELGNIAASPQFETNKKRVRNRPFLNHLLAERIAQHPQRTLLKHLAARHVPAGPINDLADVFNLPAAAALILRDEETELAAARQIAFPNDGAPVTAPPALGAHTRIVLGNLLGYDDAKITHLLEHNVLGNR